MNRKPIFTVLLGVAGWLLCGTAAEAQHTSSFSTDPEMKRPARASAARTPSMSGHGKMSRLNRPAGLSRASGAPAAGGQFTRSNHFTRTPTEPRSARRPTRATARPSSGARSTRDGRPPSAKPENGFRMRSVNSSGVIGA